MVLRGAVTGDDPSPDVLGVEMEQRFTRAGTLEGVRSGKQTEDGMVQMKCVKLREQGQAAKGVEQDRQVDLVVTLQRTRIRVSI